MRTITSIPSTTSLLKLIQSIENNPVPFRNYQALSKYLQEKPIDANLIKSRLITSHIPQVNCTNDTILDFAQLIYCDEEIAAIVFDKLYKLIDENPVTCHYVLGAVIIACDAVQAQPYAKPENVELINLLSLLANKVIKPNIDLTSIPSSDFVVRALGAMNAILNAMIIRGLFSTNLEGITMGDLPHSDLSRFFKELQKNLKRSKGEHPWPYFLCRRAQQSLEAIQAIRTVVQEKAHKKEGPQEIGKAIIAAAQGALAFAGGCAALSIAIAGTVAGFGAPAPAIIPAAIAFGAGCIVAGEKTKDTVQHVREAYSHLHERTATTLNTLQHSMRLNIGEAFIDWEELKALPLKMLTEIQTQLNSISKWSDIDKMAIVYFFTEILLQTNAPCDFQEKIKALFDEIYKKTDEKIDSHVHMFILDNFDRLSKNYENIFPPLTITNYERLITPNERRSELLKNSIKQITQSAKHRPTMITKISEHKLVESAWFKWFKHDANLYLINKYLANLKEKITKGQLDDSEGCKQFARFYARFNRTECFLALEIPNMTSSWGNELNDNLTSLLASLNLTGSEQNEVQIIIQGRAKWKICGKFINGSLKETIGIRSTPEAINIVIPSEDKRIKYLLKTQQQVLFKAKLARENKFDQPDLDEETSKEFRDNLMKYVDIEIEKEGALIVGNHELSVALDIVHKQLTEEKAKIVDKLKLPFWKSSSRTLNASPDLLKTFDNLKNKGYKFNVTLFSGLAANTKAYISIHVSPPSNQMYDDFDIEQHLESLKNKCEETLKSNGLSVNWQKDPDGRQISITAESKILQSVHALLLNIDQKKYEDVQEIKENEECIYQCGIS